MNMDRLKIALFSIKEFILILAMKMDSLNSIISSVAYRYRKSISIIELFVSIYIDIYRVLSN